MSGVQLTNLKLDRMLHCDNYRDSTFFIMPRATRPKVSESQPRSQSGAHTQATQKRRGRAIEEEEEDEEQHKDEEMEDTDSDAEAKVGPSVISDIHNTY